MEYQFDKSITKLYVSGKNGKNIKSMKQIINLHVLTNLTILDLSFNNINVIEGLENLINLQKLDLSHNNITIIEGLDNLINLQELKLNNNKITTIQNLYNLTNLKYLNLHNNKITVIEGIDNLTNLKELWLTTNKINSIQNLDNLSNLQELYLYNNQISIIEGLEKLTNLQKLYLNNNNIHIIEGLEKSSNLRYLNLSNNKINIVNNLNSLTNLEHLNLSVNNITIIENLYNLTNLYILYLHHNNINTIEVLDNLTNLHYLYLQNNNITELPLTLCNLRNISGFDYIHNPIEYIPLPVQRWLDILNRRITYNNMVYNDRQNIHNHHIQNSFRKSLSNILKDKDIYDLDFIKQHIIDSDILTQATKESLISYIDSREEHSTYLINYGDLLRYVYTRIINNDNKNNLLSILNEEVKDSLCMCFTGRMTRLLNVLNGFYNDIEIQISDSEQITNIIMSLKNRFDETELKEAVKQELTERQFNETVINEWLEYI